MHSRRTLRRKRSQYALAFGARFGDLQDLDASICRDASELGGEFTVVVSDGVGRAGIERRRLTELLR